MSVKERIKTAGKAIGNDGPFLLAIANLIVSISDLARRAIDRKRQSQLKQNPTE